MRLFFHLLYHPFAWAYDFIAAVVSLGRWQTWVKSIQTYLKEGNILEIGFGPGHLQKSLSASLPNVYGLDRSKQMGKLAYHQLKTLEKPSILPGLVRGEAKNLPFAAQSFQTIISTFPAPFILEREVIEQIFRVLKTDGRLVVLFAAWMTGKSPIERALLFLFRLTGQSPPLDTDFTPLMQVFEQAGFATHLEWQEVQATRLLFIIGRKK